MPTAAESPFARRMMEKGMPESMQGGPEARIFLDPPEIIQIAFGGRPWFFATGCRASHRIGIFKGIGWALDPMKVRAPEAKNRDINYVRIYGPTPHSKGLHLMEFLHHDAYEGGNNACDRGDFTVITVQAGVQLGNLKQTYVDVLGEIFA